MDEEWIKHSLNQEIEILSLNKLTELGNQAIRLKLIAGHGYRGGKYEILRQGKALMMSPEEAQTYLENLIKDIGASS
ncbi:MAG TPA: hypothetical protein DEG17_18235 [Cyanobacteria bacterium UBA11149]|nr:hypothetical protein [Cyanobacteria bacterium UBA11367]HBE58453.1 hypothetical protein [Cyanobacteria bacterium UBA11366]HBK65494.1 hypothetical protein [Cyanobacteria bacterium UBA11166]HBR73480.1 hypothetical protein [Cyanobacteria bacterium UBA11159]HBS71813.1 hypothetical protein [Cyanobacteria bacterium UBA11153]HBW90756.1 hypothetical protein [Cyanobacteria bacterium UBA11149]HCA94259.1 hypothetical protein [Cyanobacteria bacterium UBA9226]